MKIEGHENFIRDTHSGAVINTNTEEFLKYKERRKRAKQKEEEFNSLQQKVETLEKLVYELTRKNSN